jgi:hypothetical protein
MVLLGLPQEIGLVLEGGVHSVLWLLRTAYLSVLTRVPSVTALWCTVG